MARNRKTEPENYQAPSPLSSAGCLSVRSFRYGDATGRIRYKGHTAGANPPLYTHHPKKGSLQSAMIAGARRYDKVPYVFYGPETLINELSNGRPAGVLLNLGLEMAPRWHYAVVTGVDFENSRIILHSGTNKKRADETCNIRSHVAKR